MTDIVIALIVILFLVILVIVPNIKVLSKNRAMVVERFGAFLKIIDQPGVYILIPLLDRAIQVVNLEQMEKKFSCTIKDEENSITYNIEYSYQVIDVKLFVYSTLDALSVFEKKIKSYLDSSVQINDTIVHELKEHAEIFGLNLIQINLK